ncbi:DNA-binding transcriptional regulator, MarR family [Corynebacterium mycetoides]|uniref:DNA-binding transcriptional regulator, MarR family n=1 Tax=Corynebacterium mycetoides TaxID=38302 RepID=A0A1G9PDR8_9CORY|nr:MarR family transcriptional regulator [Corynebacterium mycetoides]SDL96367.1 DNA-binding transcriptional regulator, MarR family [Corynebacterium mycetoides]
MLLKRVRGARITRQLDLTFNESLVLSTIRDNPGITSGDIAEHLQSDKSTISRQLATLHTRGYVDKRKRDGNHRINDLALTSAGARALEQADDTWIRLTEAQLEGWTQREKDDFLALLRKFNAPR